MTYYYYPDANCDDSTCDLDVGFTTSQDGGKTWTRGKQLAGPMKIAWLPNTFSGPMVADYISSSYVDGNPFGVFIVAHEPKNGLFSEAAYTTKQPLLVPDSEPRFSSKGEKQISHGISHFEFHDVEREAQPPREEPKK